MITLKINDQNVEIPEGASILDAARSADIAIPTLCFLEGVNRAGGCRMCLVEIEGRRGLAPACSTKAEDGMVVYTNTLALEAYRRRNLELICSNHRQDCARCIRFPHCELHSLCRQYGIDDRENMFNRPEDISRDLVHLERDHSKCILCRRCVSTCRQVQGISAISVLGRGCSQKVAVVHGAESDCIHCGQCILACPTGALSVKNDTRRVGVALAQRKKHVIAVVSEKFPSQFGEYFGEPACEEGKAAAVLRRLGFRAVFSSRQSAAEELTAQCREVLRRVQDGGDPLISSTCPSVRKFCTVNQPELKNYLADAGDQMTAAATFYKKAYGELHGLKPEDVYVVTVSTCTADKYVRMNLADEGASDAVLSTQEIYLMFERACVSSFSAQQVWDRLPPEAFDRCGEGDCPAEVQSKAVMAALGAECISVEKGTVTEMTYEYKGRRFQTVYADGMKAVQRLLQQVKDGSSEYAFLELLACPGGCANGGGRSRRGCNHQTPPECR